MPESLFTHKFEHDALFQLRANGDHSLILDFKKDQDHLVLIHQLTDYIIKHPPEFLINVIPSSLSITLVFSATIFLDNISRDNISRGNISRDNLLSGKISSGNLSTDNKWQDFFTSALNACQDESPEIKNHHIPVCYGQIEHAADFYSVCEILQCTASQLIEAHSSAQYRVDMLGFLPGFAYLSGLPEALKIPRKSNPTINVRAGSVAIAEQYSAIYPIESPAGWHVIGHTQFTCFDWRKAKFCPFRPLDTVQFVPMSNSAFNLPKRVST